MLLQLKLKTNGDKFFQLKKTISLLQN